MLDCDTRAAVHDAPREGVRPRAEVAARAVPELRATRDPARFPADLARRSTASREAPFDRPARRSPSRAP
ncbi:hypothetical protein ACQPYK_44990 [Streptosporangium sp. CA-135522]|uniref:hypothetical protein n=1 Tax=Streptosporangium sp. CA-135522 TaxID=3240072 RepID=UPI003D8D087A